VKSKGVTGRPLNRHTPTLWNLAWSPLLFWDGRARSLEAQARFPIEHRDEMGNALTVVAARLAAIPAYMQAFKRAFPATPNVTGRAILKAVASFERTLVSPLTRFDAWVSGNDAALTKLERAGFRFFVGKARCAGCHFGFAFTDRAFHDIGLPTSDLGRGAVLGLPGLNYAFKTPGLRELVWTAPYMHDGSLATLGDVLRHYVAGVKQRPTLAHELRRPLRLSQADRAALIAFLKSLSSATPPEPAGGNSVR
jgi:cytochrome c peroxidase